MCLCICMYIHTHAHIYVCGVENWVDYTAIADLLGDNLTMAGYLKIEGISVSLLCTYIRTCMRTYVCVSATHVHVKQTQNSRILSLKETV